MTNRYTLQIVQNAVRFIYTSPRGQAVILRDALATLQENPLPKDCQPFVLDDLLNVYTITLAEYRIVYQVFEAQRVVRILVVE